MENRNSRPVVPLPNPGEGGPVYPSDPGQIPVVPLPNPGEGGPVYPGNSSPNRPSQPSRPNRPSRPSNPSWPYLPNTPNRPNRPNQPTRPSTPNVPNAPGASGGIQWLPGPAYPPVSAPYAAVRFLNATNGYAPFRVLVDGDTAVRLLDAGASTGYLRIPAGLRRVTVAGTDGYVYLQQSLRFTAGGASTVAIVNRTGGLALRRIDDNCARC